MLKAIAEVNSTHSINRADDQLVNVAINQKFRFLSENDLNNGPDHLANSISQL